MASNGWPPLAVVMTACRRGASPCPSRSRGARRSCRTACVDDVSVKVPLCPARLWACAETEVGEPGEEYDRQGRACGGETEDERPAPLPLAGPVQRALGWCREVGKRATTAHSSETVKKATVALGTGWGLAVSHRPARQARLCVSAAGEFAPHVGSEASRPPLQPSRTPRCNRPASKCHATCLAAHHAVQP